MSLSTLNRSRKMLMDDKYSIKNLIFVNPMKNYVVPVNTEGHKLYGCIDCGDKFVCESSYNYHVNRRSVKITYLCRICGKHLVYMNRCNMLSHIRSHVFRRTTINLVEIKIEPLPREDMIFGLFHLNEPATEEEVRKSLNNECIEKENESGQENPEISEIQCSNSSSQTVSIVPVKQSKAPRAIRVKKCIECQCRLRINNCTAEQARAKHYMTPNSDDNFNIFQCPICFYILPTQCALNAHLRNHKGDIPNICPECGRYLNKNKKSNLLTMKHHCPGFTTIKNEWRVSCPGECGIVRWQEYIFHHMQKHIKKVYKCSKCKLACFTQENMEHHLVSQHSESIRDTIVMLLYYQCSLCPGRLVLQKCMESHLKMHLTSLKLVFPCPKCTTICHSIYDLLSHFKLCTGSTVLVSITKLNHQKYKVDKQCPNCKEIVTSYCRWMHEIYDLSNRLADCPNRCSAKIIHVATVPEHFTGELIANCEIQKVNEEYDIQCGLCRIKMNSNWNSIKDHFAESHKEHQCIDVKVVLEQILPTDGNSASVNSEIGGIVRKRHSNEGVSTNKVKKFINMSSNQSTKNACAVIKINSSPGNTIEGFACTKCGLASDTAEEFRAHIMIHRDPSAAYQCMECGSCFAVKPSFSTHLFVAHGIKEVDEYIQSKDCYNVEAFENDNLSLIINGPLKENQCKICREEFQNYDQLEKHFRVHGMAFLMTKTQKK